MFHTSQLKPLIVGSNAWDLVALINEAVSISCWDLRSIKFFKFFIKTLNATQYIELDISNIETAGIDDHII